MSTGWTMSDAWVFAAISSDRAHDMRSLTQVIAIADAINHAILVEAEFTSAVARLLSAGLVGADPVNDRYWMTDAGLRVRVQWRTGLFGWIDSIPAALRQLAEPIDAGYSLPPDAFRTAVREYLKD
ncbi:hypothetical protein ACRYCC_11330 [Actinomadura scrupuli]|uniref:hypothetical protein n=1 Tax=Actinomadura scrupuli TaxID=559629 RepID=UPI003D97BCD0